MGLFITIVGAKHLYFDKMDFFVDTHTHLYVEDFDADRDAVIKCACETGVGKMFLPNIDSASVASMLQLCDQYPHNCYPMIGLHPTELSVDWQAALDAMEKLLQNAAHPYIAVGEVGLDFYWDASRKQEQEKAFRQQIDWALHYKLPLMIHTRNAHQELVHILNDYRHAGLSGVFHCFGGTTTEAMELLSFDGFALGIGGIVTFKKSSLPDVLSHIPLSRIVLETDSPYLAPTPYRGKRNESAHIPLIANSLASIYRVSVNEVKERTTQTVMQLFPKVDW